ncbi:MAG: TylF/MycF/NovP-related O-methyltransferase [Bacteroidota bacterium]|nr:TylF/MycF/NovP-related O-methyltransferase [Bacteroidota bacterium]MDP4251878.1 TylF/MycF/NovP-related O-methyltransferase [Bacteroidota bacterium]
MKLRLIKFFKDFLLWSGILRIFSPLNHLFLFTRNFNLLRKWISGANRNTLLINDFYSWKRDYPKRFKLYEAVSEGYQLDKKELLYLEFGVASGSSFFWWLKKNTHPGSVFRGFDTFEGLPEDWGGFKKGAMAFSLGEVSSDDPRAGFEKGVFQESLNPFIEANRELLHSKPKLIHLDADLFSSTIFVLSQLYPYIHKGDIIFFDEFNVANHEFFAWQIFTESFYVKLKPIGAVNNFYQTAFVVE